MDKSNDRSNVLFFECSVGSSGIVGGTSSLTAPLSSAVAAENIDTQYFSFELTCIAIIQDVLASS